MAVRKVAVTLPEELNEAITRKLTQEQIAQTYKFRLEAEEREAEELAEQHQRHLAAAEAEDAQAGELVRALGELDARGIVDDTDGDQRPERGIDGD